MPYWKSTILNGIYRINIEIPYFPGHKAQTLNNYDATNRIMRFCIGMLSGYLHSQNMFEEEIYVESLLTKLKLEEKPF